MDYAFLIVGMPKNFFSGYLIATTLMRAHTQIIKSVINQRSLYANNLTNAELFYSKLIRCKCANKSFFDANQTFVK